MAGFGLIRLSEQEFLSHSVEPLLDSVAAMQPTRLPLQKALADSIESHRLQELRKLSQAGSRSTTIAKELHRQRKLASFFREFPHKGISSWRQGRGCGVGRGRGVGVGLGVGLGGGVGVTVGVGVGEGPQGLTSQLKISVVAMIVAPSLA
jgi:hypothetical protein